MGNSRFPAGNRLARDVEFVCELFLRHAGAFAASGDFGSYDHTEDLLLLGSFYTKTVGKATMSTWNFRNFELRRAPFYRSASKTIRTVLLKSVCFYQLSVITNDEDHRSSSFGK
jgi:hypothetical protein